MQSLKPASGNSLQGLRNSCCGPLGLTPQADLREVRRQPPRSPGLNCQPAEPRLGFRRIEVKGTRKALGPVLDPGKRGCVARKHKGDGSPGHRVIHSSGGTRGPGPGVRSAHDPWRAAALVLQEARAATGLSCQDVPWCQRQVSWTRGASAGLCAVA